MEPDEDSGNSLGLKIMFGLLFIIFIGEIMYFFVLPIKKPFLPITPIIPTFAPLTPTPAPTKAPTKIPTPTNIVKNQLADTSSPTQEFEGKIIEINTFTFSSNLKGINRIESSLVLETNKKEKKQIIFYFEKEDILNMKITNNSQDIIFYKDLKVGQNIILNLNPIRINILN